MLVILADTHAETGTRLTGAHYETVTSASFVAHAGDFTTEAVLDSFEDITQEFVAVAGNSDTPAVSQRLPQFQTFEYGGRRFLVTHGHQHDRTSLSLLARQEEADVVVVGHTHRAGVDHVGDDAVVNPGSHADPRDETPTVAVVTRTGGTLQLRFQTTGGQSRETVVL